MTRCRLIMRRSGALFMHMVCAFAEKLCYAGHAALLWDAAGDRGQGQALLQGPPAALFHEPQLQQAGARRAAGLVRLAHRP